jgi:hypothetical protein
MTLNLFGNTTFSIGLRNGVGIDLEFTETRPVWITSNDWIGTRVASFEGVVILFPFVIITIGQVYEAKD